MKKIKIQPTLLEQRGILHTLNNLYQQMKRYEPLALRYPNESKMRFALSKKRKDAITRIKGDYDLPLLQNWRYILLRRKLATVLMSIGSKKSKEKRIDPLMARPGGKESGTVNLRDGIKWK